MLKVIYLVIMFSLMVITVGCGGSDNNSDVSLETMIGQMTMVGFRGTDPNEDWPRLIVQQLETGHLGGVVFYRFNIDNQPQVEALTRAIGQARAPYPVLVSLDQEGGKVQRLNSANGFKDFLSAQKVAEQMAPGQARDYYRDLAAMVQQAGFNLNFAPVVDLNRNPESPAIGKLERSFGADPEQVIAYALAVISAHHSQGVLCTLKHFPGHGSATGDTHLGFVDVTDTWNPIELEPFFRLSGPGGADMVMVAHTFNRNLDPVYPASLSPGTINGLLRQTGLYDGVVISDDLQMGAIAQYFDLETVIVQAVNAGNDILLFSNYFAPDPQIPDKVKDVLLNAVADGRVSTDRIRKSFARIVKIKAGLMARPG
ncbi:MAG: glycoside hydrolase family 3 protein [Deltaproteobacteria bacterium]|nr:glycoside hydrolase family 3 protein [Deltaproteobacteria bacterium]